MRVHNPCWRATEDARPSAERYRAAGYRVAIVEHSSERAGSHIELQCTYCPEWPGDGAPC